MPGQEEVEEGTQCVQHRLNIPTWNGMVSDAHCTEGHQAFKRREFLPPRWLCFDRWFVAIHVMTLLKKVEVDEKNTLDDGHLVARVAEKELVVVTCPSTARAHLAVDALPRLKQLAG